MFLWVMAYDQKGSAMKVTHFFLLIMVITILCPDPAHAYLDPATTAFLLQGLAACCVTVLAFWRRLREICKKILLRKQTEETTSGEQ